MSFKSLHRINEVLLLLADAQFHSGQALGEALGITRSAINQHIQKLLELGVDIYSVQGKGYRLAQPIELLDSHVIASYNRMPVDQLQVHSVVTSTNDELKHYRRSNSLNNGYVFFAEAQTAGRGRRGRTWLSPFGSNLYMSVYWKVELGVNAAMGMSVAVGIAIAAALRHMGIADAGVKWPNDVYVHGKKIAGVLIDIESCDDGTADCIVGIGLNIDMPATIATQIDQQWTDVATELVEPWSRNEVAATLYRYTVNYLQQFSKHGLSPLIEQWTKLDVYFNKPVKLIMGNREVRGLCRGIDEFGAVLIDNGDQVVRYFGGELSLRGDDAAY
ncbi:bifunctional biotin--[acetyl-CoA-carboxylase] ligase/biotin operon repressor BirA [Idiomarina seosinensis]|uniref:bifunctional biotin--[acetyl-CoA-carboxylase] ligase/biotin operon repressor BirA n=1 Tax=Idiomarina seosinensis TaxID=281739 RepID=UPI003850A4BB